jgi:WhiB family redox-sensing transcriptional regulator
VGRSRAQVRDDPVPLLSPIIDWVGQGSCRDHAPELFDEFPRVPELFDFDRLADAVAICAGCPVRAECLAWGVLHKISGVHGGRLLIAGQPIDPESLSRRHQAAERRAAQLRGRRRHRHVA